MVTQRFVDAWMAFPGLLLLMTIMSILGTGAPQIIIVLGLTYGIGSSRVVRGAVIGVSRRTPTSRPRRRIGSPPWRTVLRHVLPNMHGADHHHLQHHHRRGDHHRGQS